MSDLPPGVTLQLHKRRCTSNLVRNEVSGKYILCNYNTGDIIRLPTWEVVAVFYQCADLLGVDGQDARDLLEERHWR